METTVTPERLMQMAWGFAPPLVIEAAVRGGVFDALADGPRSVGQVAAATAGSGRGLRAVMDALVGLGLLAKPNADRYALTPESAAFLVTSAPAYRGDFFRHISTQLVPSWLHLTQAMR